MLVSATTLGVAAVAACATVLILDYWSHPHARPYPFYGYLGLAELLASKLLLFRGPEASGGLVPEGIAAWVGMYFTPLAWTGYILAVDAAVYALRGRSLLRSTPSRFVSVALWSIPLWVIFEGYNLHLQNWIYVGLHPLSLTAELAGRAWAYATITPALFETAELFATLGYFEKASGRGGSWLVRMRRPARMVGILFLLVPLLLPHSIAVYLFGAVWIGFILLLEPVNYARGYPSLLRDVEQGRGQRLYSLLASGMLCGLLWEFWNYWALAKWHYVFPIGQEWKIFEMPLVGYVGFPFFAWECFAMYHFVTGELGRRIERATGLPAGALTGAGGSQPLPAHGRGKRSEPAGRIRRA